ncbi:hypothetical protein [Streptomyces sp. NPDC102283]|uniref:hypothetical protein n=1 Tax=Streptomyces sp. NPDC102283 TaxID=3366155 RepID=UPI00381B109F
MAMKLVWVSGGTFAGNTGEQMRAHTPRPALLERGPVSRITEDFGEGRVGTGG